MRILRNIFRRKVRAFLTISGIAIGVFALVVMGAMAEKMNLLVAGGITYYEGKVIVSDETATSMMAMPAPMRVDTVGDLEDERGVARASASVGMLIDDLGAVNMGTPPMISATDFRELGYEKFPISYKEGRALKSTDRGKVVVGSDLVKSLDAVVGGTVEIRDKKFEVIGITDKTLTAPDSIVTISMEEAQELYHEDLPAAVRRSITPDTIATQIAVYPEPGVDPDVLARQLNRNVDGINASGPLAFKEQIVESMAILNAIIYAIALISLLVGSLSVVNTMTMSVSERTREVGIRKAIGASDGAVMRQFISESAVIGLLGGLIGLAIGALAVTGMNAGSSGSGTVLFLLTPRLAIGSVVFALALGTVSGLYPAWHAAQLNPVQALRYE